MNLTPQQIESLKTKLGLSPQQVAQLKNSLTEFASQADQKADGLLAKISKSRWTWAIVAGILVAAWLLGFVQG